MLGLSALAALLPLAGSAAQDGASDEPGVVEVTAKDYEFELPAEISSGWTTFEFRNAGEEEHYFNLARLPEGKTFGDFQTEVEGAFEEVWNRYAGREISRSEMLESLRSKIPEWYLAGVEPSGGAGLTEPGETSRVTVDLEPGTYVVECAVKTPQGSWHTFRGMVRGLEVSPGSGSSSPPEADATLTLSEGEIEVTGELTPGSRTVAVHVQENPEGLANYAVHLVRLSGDTQLQDVVEWSQPLELGRYRAPAPGYSLGGVQPQMVGETAYMTVDLKPGRYAWISPVFANRGMVKTFTVE